MRLRMADWDEAPLCWPVIEPWIAAALKRSLVYRAPDVLRLIMRGEMQLWLAEEEGIRACAVTEIRRCPKATICWFVAVGGPGIDDWIHLEAGIARWAKQAGCAAIEGAGRKGWERQMRGEYEPTFVVYRKLLT